ncbi:MAG: hypothetical protein EP332_13940 [Bacteroidetes bacterium]|nr:MAG: hypothetical protein EP332_13940 [Bacteroidota bacterium]
MRNLYFFLFLFLGIGASAQILKTQTIDVKDHKDYKDMSWLDSLAKNYSMIMYGEDHRYVQGNRDLEFKTLSYLAKKKKLVYITEFGKVSTWLLNRYVMENDSSLENFFTIQAVNSFSQFYRKLKNFKKDNPDANFEIQGVDIERQSNDVVKAYSILLKDVKGASDSVDLLLGTLEALDNLYEQNAMTGRYRRNYGSYFVDNPDDTLSARFYFQYDTSLLVDMPNSTHNLYYTFLNIQKEMNHHKAELMQLAGKDSSLLSSFMEEADKMLYWKELKGYGDLREAVYRERSMLDNFQRVYEKDTNALYFGMFGRCHIGKTEYVLECGLAKFNSFVRQVNTRIPSLGPEKVVSIGVYYSQEPISYNYDFNRNFRNRTVPYPLDSLYANSPSDSITVYYLGQFNESNFYADRFDWVIINSIGVRKTVNKRKVAAKDGYMYEDWRQHLIAGYGVRMLQLGSLNDLGYKPTPYLQNFHISLTDHDEEYEVVGGSFDRFNSFASYKMGDSATMNFNGYKLNFILGKDLVSSNRLDVIVMGGIGYQSLKLEYENQNIANTSSLFGEAYREIYSKNSMNLDLQLRLQYTYHALTFGAMSGYSMDLGKRYWRSDGARATGAPRGTNSGAYANVYVGFWWW